MRIATDDDEVKFNQAWLQAQPKVVRTLLMSPNANTAVGLTKQGYKVDGNVFIQGQSPYRRNKIAIMFGYTWVPSYGQPTLENAPGLHEDGQPDYDPDNPPAGSIKISLDFDELAAIFAAPAGAAK